MMVNDDAYILDRSDQVILDLLAPEPSPAGALEALLAGTNLSKVVNDCRALAPTA